VHGAPDAGGVATEGSHALVALAFADPAVQRVTARALTTNAASLRVMRKLGMSAAGRGECRGLRQARSAVDRVTWAAVTKASRNGNADPRVPGTGR
jgi:RimJ/RimL family protein N-acetyltransferase